MLLLGRATRASASTFPSEIWVDRLSVLPVLSRGVARASQVSGPSLPCAPRSNTPPGVPSPCPLAGYGTAAFRYIGPLGTWDPWFSRPHSRGSHARRPTHRRYGYPHRRKALLPACRARLWPGGVLTHWTTYRISVGIATSFLSDQPCLVASNISIHIRQRKTLRGWVVVVMRKM